MAKPWVAHGDSEELMRQQTTLAKFGEFTLRTEDLTEILQEATRLVAEGLNANSLLRFHQGGRLVVRLITDTERLTVPVQMAVPLALITNEFITNSLKYAFPQGTGTIGIRLERHDDGNATLTLWDTGSGLPEQH